MNNIPPFTLREFFKTHAHCKGHFALTAAGQPCNAAGPYAHAFCAQGALKCKYRLAIPTVTKEAYASYMTDVLSLNRLASEQHGNTLIYVNDELGLEAVLKLADQLGL